MTLADPYSNDRRVLLVPVSMEILSSMMRGEWKRSDACEIPTTAKILQVYDDPSRHQLFLVLQDDSFELTSPGRELPIWNPEHFRSDAPGYGEGLSEDHLSHKDVVGRFCALQGEVSHHFARYDHPNDCFCRDPEHDGLSHTADEHFRNSGASLLWIERLVRGVLHRFDAPKEM